MPPTRVTPRSTAPALSDCGHDSNEHDANGNCLLCPDHHQQQAQRATVIGNGRGGRVKVDR